MRPALLDSVEAIDPAWLHAVLGGAPVADVRAEPVGHGTTSSVARLHLRYDGPTDAPASLIAKFPRPAGLRSSAAVVVEGFAREVAAYRAFSRATFRIPQCHHAEIGADGIFNLLLEDLDAGCRAGDQIAGCSVADAGAVVRELAGLHGGYVGADVDAMAWPRRRAPLAPRNAALYAEGARIMRARFADRLPGEALDLIDAAVPLLERWYAAPPVLPSLIHADPRVDNILFEDREGAVRACLIDLQSIAVGDPANDLAYFLTGSLDPADRRACERDLVAAHAARMRAAGADYADDRAWDLYRAYAIAGMAGTVMAAPLVLAGTDMDRLLVTLATRNCAAVADLDGIAAARTRMP